MIGYKQLPTIPNVSAGNSVTVTLPVGNTYETVVLKYSGVTLAQLKNIRIEANGRLISEYPTAERIVSMDAHYDRASQAGYLFIHFNRPELDKLEQSRFFGLDTHATQGIATAHIKLDIDSEADAPKLEAFARTVQSVAGAINYLTKVRRTFVAVSGAGQFDIDNITIPPGASIAAIHLYMPDGSDADGICQITKAELLVDNVNWHDINASEARMFQKSNGRVPQTAQSTVIDLIQDGDIQHALPLTQNIQDFRLRCTAVEAGQVEVMVEYIDQWGAGRF